MWGYHEFGWMGFGMHGAGMVLFWGLVMLATVVLIRAFAMPAPTATVRREEDALEILRERFARGEVSEEEFRAIRESLAAR